MTSKREHRIQKLIQVIKTVCNKCSTKEYERCLKCDYYKETQKLLKKIEYNGGDTDD
jgi:hypothetical protein